jgi:hypothetical protein
MLDFGPNRTFVRRAYTGNSIHIRIRISAALAAAACAVVVWEGNRRELYGGGAVAKLMIQSLQLVRTGDE